MDVVELKKQIEDKALGDEFLILKYSDSTFLAHQYIDAIAEFKGLEIRYIQDIEDASSILGGYLNVAFIDKYTNMMYCDYLRNLIVVCKEVDSGGEPFMVELPKLEEWQIRDYALTKLPGLDSQYVEWLCKMCGNIDRLSLEVDKLGVFSKGNQQKIFQQLNESEGYVDLTDLTSYDIVNAVIKKDLNVVKEYFTEQLNFDALGITSLLIRNFKQVIDVQINPKATPDALGMSYKQFKAVQGCCGYYTNAQLIEIYSFLLKIDYRLKTRQLENDELKDYVIPYVLSL